MTILLNVQRRFKPKDKSWLNDAVRFIGEAIQGIGTALPMETKRVCLKVVGRRAILPKDMVDHIGFSHCGHRIPVAKGIPIEQRNEGGGYWMNPGYLVCPFNVGEVICVYKAIPVDDRGLPLVYNDFDYQRAVEWYIMMSMLSSGYEHKVFNYKDCDAKWQEHSAKACNAMKMPSRDEAESYGNCWTRLFNDGLFMENFGRGLEYSDDTILGEAALPLYTDENKLDRNRLANNS
jgi:hypothetical protein